VELRGDRKGSPEKSATKFRDLFSVFDTPLGTMHSGRHRNGGPSASGAMGQQQRLFIHGCQMPCSKLASGPACNLSWHGGQTSTSTELYRAGKSLCSDKNPGDCCWIKPPLALY
jgi:hypothetical protein